MKVTSYITLLILSFFICRCNFKSEPDHYPSDFTFRIDGWSDDYDSETQIYKRGYSNGDSSAKVSLTEKELQSIFEDFEEFEFFTFPKEFECEKFGMFQEPNSTTVISVTYNKKFKRSRNTSLCEFKTQRTNSGNFDRLARKIWQILDSKNEVKKMAKTDIVLL
ncbi:hypothetical protein [Dyadobacter frigoris]|uniref:Uncharacterized protein n=1 Tax=Dyadobacter frigoris TaxID=2576211 RepID=A0A4U6CU32_9BACT|nr:hypothetical protein [Dyadobacter frigoris]TKT88112.1 hypothetical protein FDK13_27445 [Dyadobacter frigoris]GLU53725.1 hypothetical protein Dfri01_31860 [Dyadobacter frigoris]